MTGGFVLDTGASLLLQPLNSNRPQKRSFTQRRKEGHKGTNNSPLCLWFSTLWLCVKTASVLFVMVVLDGRMFISFLRQRFTGHAILALNPLAQVDKLAPLRTEGTKRIVFPLDLLTAGWTLHESERCWSFDQYSSFDECDRTFAAHGIQADRDAFTGGAHNRGDFAVGQGNIDEYALGFRDAVTHGKVGQ